MKSIIRVLSMSMLLLSLLGGQTQASGFETVNIEYNNKVNGYSVKVFWKPIESQGEHIIGPAIIEMYKDEESIHFYISNNNFSILKIKLTSTFTEDDYGIPSFNKENILLTYDENSIIPSVDCKFGTTNEPFFFKDVDFDGESELIISEVGNGQRYYASFKVYKLSDGYLQDELYGITYQKPFISFDEMSEVDYGNKQITLYRSGGGCGSNYEIYNLEDNSFILNTIIEFENISGKCYEIKYEVINSSKKVLSRKEVK